MLLLALAKLIMFTVESSQRGENTVRFYYGGVRIKPIFLGSTHQMQHSYGFTFSKFRAQNIFFRSFIFAYQHCLFTVLVLNAIP